MKRPAVKGKVFLALQLSLLFFLFKWRGFQNGCKTAISFSAILLLLWVGSSDYGGLCLVWQQILHYLPLTFAYANKGVSLVWGMIWGALFFQEKNAPGI